MGENLQHTAIVQIDNDAIYMHGSIQIFHVDGTTTPIESPIIWGSLCVRSAMWVYFAHRGFTLSNAATFYARKFILIPKISKYYNSQAYNQS